MKVFVEDPILDLRGSHQATCLLPFAGKRPHPLVSAFSFSFEITESVF